MFTVLQWFFRKFSLERPVTSKTGWPVALAYRPATAELGERPNAIELATRPNNTTFERSL
jgi:hypothetical protein